MLSIYGRVVRDMALKIAIEERVTDDILILTDSRSAVESIQSNEMSVYKHEIALRIKEKVNQI